MRGAKEYKHDFFKFKAKMMVELEEKEVVLGDIVGDAKAIVIVNVASRDELAA